MDRLLFVRMKWKGEIDRLIFVWMKSFIAIFNANTFFYGEIDRLLFVWMKSFDHRLEREYFLLRRDWSSPFCLNEMKRRDWPSPFFLNKIFWALSQMEIYFFEDRLTFSFLFELNGKEILAVNKIYWSPSRIKIHFLRIDWPSLFFLNEIFW